MNQEQAIALVVRRKRTFRSRDKIAQELAATDIIEYYQARHFVHHVEQRYARRVAVAQMPLVLGLGLPALLLGLVFLVGPLASLVLGNYHIGMMRQFGLGIGLFLGGFIGIMSLLSKFFRR